MSSRIELIRSLAVMGEPPARGHAPVADALALGPLPGSAEYTELFLFQLYPYASVYLGPEGMLGGVARDRVAGFWRALGLTPPAEPDHLTALLGLYATISDRIQGADGAEAALLEQGRVAALHEHLVPWVHFFLERVAEVAGPFYSRWAELLAAALAEEVRGAPPAKDPPAHLREAPGLPDPRVGGGEAFLHGLLAPVRSGLFLTRGDLVRVGRSLGLGLRLGERRFVLQHLLGQEPIGVLGALRDEASVRAAGYDESVPLLGVVARFWAERARTTALLLDELAAEGALSLAETAHEVAS